MAAAKKSQPEKTEIPKSLAPLTTEQELEMLNAKVNLLALDSAEQTALLREQNTLLAQIRDRLPKPQVFG